MILPISEMSRERGVYTGYRFTEGRAAIVVRVRVIPFHLYLLSRETLKAGRKRGEVGYEESINPRESEGAQEFPSSSQGRRFPRGGSSRDRSSKRVRENKV